MQVLKFGGTSVANAENINKVVAIVKEAAKKDKTIVVVSALGGVTDLLLNAAKDAASGDGRTLSEPLRQRRLLRRRKEAERNCSDGGARSQAGNLGRNRLRSGY